LAILTVGSLFAGIGGFDLGLERAGMEIEWQVEYEPYCQKVLAKHWPRVTRYGDITTVEWARVAPVDLVCGGFPCQPVSVAGHQLGTADARWLWPEFVRCLRVLRPPYVLVENVPGLLLRTVGDVLRDLAVLGYDAEWRVLSAATFGAPHLRKRVWIVAHARCAERRAKHDARGCAEQVSDGHGQAAGGVGERSERLADADHERSSRYGRQLQPEGAFAQPVHGDPKKGRGALAHAEGQSGRARRGAEDKDGERRGRSGDRDRRPTESGVGGGADGLSAGVDGGGLILHGPLPCSSHWDDGDWESGVPRTAQGVPRRVPRLKGLGNAVVPQIVEWIGQRIVEYDKQNKHG